MSSKFFSIARIVTTLSKSTRAYCRRKHKTDVIIEYQKMIYETGIFLVLAGTQVGREMTKCLLAKSSRGNGKK